MNRAIKCLITLLIFISYSCQQEAPTESIKVDELHQLSCFIPDDAIIKFSSLNENIFGDLILNFLDEKAIQFSTEDTKKIREWSKNEVFGLTSSNIVEWQLYDEDFCQTKKGNLIGKDDQVLNNSALQICNSVLNEDSVLGNSWTLYGDDWELQLMTCNKIKKSLDFVPYYEVNERGGDEEGLSTQREMMKHYVVSKVYLEYKSSSAIVRELLVQDEAFLYSGILNFAEEDYVVQAN